MQSTFKTTRTVTIDRLSPTDNGRDLFRLGALIVGSGKTVDRNVVQVFNLNTPAAG